MTCIKPDFAVAFAAFVDACQARALAAETEARGEAEPEPEAEP